MAEKRLKMSTARDVRQSLNRICNLVLNGELGTKEANCIICGANVILQSIRADEMQSRIDELENTIHQIEEIQKGQ